MKLHLLFLTAIGLVHPSMAYAQHSVVVAVPEQRQLFAVTDEEAELLISEL